MGAGISETRRLAGLEAVMANLPSDDRPEQSTNGTIKRLHDRSTRALRGFGEEQTLADSEQTLAASEQTLTSRPPRRALRARSSATRPRRLAIWWRWREIGLPPRTPRGAIRG